MTPVFSDSKWTIATGNTFYNCQAGVDYTVSGDEIKATLSLLAPADFVRFTVYGTADKPLYCDKVKGWKDVAIGSDMTFSNATCTEYMDDVLNVGNSMYKDFFGRIEGGGTSLNGATCNFSMEVNDVMYIRTVPLTTGAKGFSMSINTTGTNPWTAITGKAKATIGGSEVDVKWIQLRKDGPKFAEYNVGATGILNNGTVMSFTDAAKTGEEYVWGKNWRTPTEEELNELLLAATEDGSEKVGCEFVYKKDDVESVLIYSGKGVYAANALYLPVPGTNKLTGGGYDIIGNYWSSTPISDKRTGDITGGSYMALRSENDTWTSKWITGALNFSICVVRPVRNEQ